jgi:uncharacterized membrane protein YqjE
MQTNGNGQRERQPLGQEMKRLADAISRLVRDHLELAKAEMREEAKRYAVDAGLGATALPFLFAALLLFDFALAFALSGPLGQPIAFALVGLLNVVVGGTFAGVAAARIRKHARPMAETSAEIQRNKELMQQIRQEMRQQHGPLPPPGVRAYAPDGKGPDELQQPEMRRDQVEEEARI